VAYIPWPFFGMGIPTARKTETGGFHGTSAGGNGSAASNGRERPRRRSCRASNETPNRACGKRRFDAFEPDALDAADRLDDNGWVASAPRVREFSGAAPGAWSIAPARNGCACLPGSASGSLAAPNAHRVAVAVAGRMRRRHFPGPLRRSRAGPGLRIRQVHHGCAGAF
jgi:hypothetical protein